MREGNPDAGIHERETLEKFRLCRRVAVPCVREIRTDRGGENAPDAATPAQEADIVPVL